MVTRPRLWLKTTSEKGPHLSCVVFTESKFVEENSDPIRKASFGLLTTSTGLLAGWVLIFFLILDVALVHQAILS